MGEKYRLTRAVTIPVGTLLHEAPVQEQRFDSHVEAEVKFNGVSSYWVMDTREAIASGTIEAVE